MGKPVNGGQLKSITNVLSVYESKHMNPAEAWETCYT